MNERGHGVSLVTASQIAALADVGPSAVSNWRKRFEDFPGAVQTTPGGKDLFELKEVEGWLTQRGRLKESGGKRLLFAAVDQLRSHVSAAQMIEVLGAALTLVAVNRRGLGPQGPVPDVRHLLGMAAGTGRPDLDRALQPLLTVDPGVAEDVCRLMQGIEEQELSDCFEWILSRGQRPDAAQSDSGSALTALITALAGEPTDVVYDPAAGWGGFLLALSQEGVRSHQPQLFGQEVNASAATIAQQRFIVENVPVNLVPGDSLVEDAWPHLLADVIVCDPPYGVKKDWGPHFDGDPRWIAGRPPAIADFAWLQHVVYHLKEEGRGYLFLPVSTLFRRGKDANLRRELLAEGVVEAILKLPPGSVPRAAIPVALWILRSSHRGGSEGSVLLVDATAISTRRKALDEQAIERLAGIVNEWRLDEPVAPPDRAVAVSVPIFDLVRRDANLDPSRWLSSDLSPADRVRQEANFKRTEETLEETRRALSTLPSVHLSVQTAEPRPWIEVQQLLDDGVARVIRGVQIKEQDCLPAGEPVVRPRDVKDGLASEPTCFVDPAVMKPRPELTRSGDVIVSPAGDRLVAAVDEEGGRVLATPVQGLRILDAFIDPVLLAAFLESPRNHRLLSGTARASIRLPDLELPLLPRNEGHELALALKLLADQERLAQKISTDTRSLRELLLSLASSSRDGRRD
jgi:hypothetical protein